MKKFPESGKWIIDGDFAYACAVNYSLLLEIDLRYQRVVNVIQISSNSLEYDFCIKLLDKIIFFPSYKGNDIAIYDFVRKKVKHVELPPESGMMLTVASNEKTAYAISLKANSIFKIDLDNYTLRCIYTPQHNDNLNRDIYVTDNKIIAMLNDNILISKDLNEEITIFEKEELPERCRDYIYRDDFLLLLGYDDEFYLRQNGVFRRVKIPKTFCGRKNYDIVGREYLISEAAIVGQFIVLIPYQSEEIVICNIMNISDVQLYNISMDMGIDVRSKEEWGIDYRAVYVKDNRFLGLYLFKEKLIAEIDIQSLRCRIVEYDFSDVSLDILGGYIMCEKNVFERELFLGYLGN